MSFDGNGWNCIEFAPKDCKPDYEAHAASLKKKLDSTVALEKALFNFSDSNEIYQFKSISSFAEMIGGVSIVKREQTKKYEEILKQIEKGGVIRQ